MDTHGKSLYSNTISFPVNATNSGGIWQADILHTFRTPATSGTAVNDYDPSAYYYTVTASKPGVAPSPQSVGGMTPQIYLLLGFTVKSEGGNNNFANNIPQFESLTNYELHTFYYDHTAELKTSMLTLPFNAPRVLGGISFGGGEAVGMTYADAGTSSYLAKVDLLLLFDPVATFNQTRFQDNRDLAVESFHYVGQNTAPSGTFEFDHSTQDPTLQVSNDHAIINGVDTVDPAHGRLLLDSEFPSSTFNIPPTVVSKAVDWYQTAKKEYVEDKRVNGADQSQWRSYATGMIANSNANFINNPGAPSGTGTFHTSQLYPANSEGLTIVNSLYPTLKANVEGANNSGSSWNSL